MNRAYLSLGSNIDPETNLPRAVAMLSRAGEVRAVSPAYATEPVGAPGSAEFLNAAVLLLTELTADELKSGPIADIEETLGRVRVPGDRNAPRTIDIDIALWNPLTPGDGPPPDPEILVRAHVAVPLAAIAPALAHPETGEPLSRIARRLTDGCEGPPPRERPEVALDFPPGG